MTGIRRIMWKSGDPTMHGTVTCRRSELAGLKQALDEKKFRKGTKELNRTFTV